MFSAARVLKGSRTLPTSRLASSTAAAAPPLRRAFTPRRSTAPAAATAFNAPATTTSKVPTAETTRERVEPGPRAPLASPPPRESAAETPASTVEPSNDSLTSYPSPPPPAGGGGGGGPAAAAIDWSTSFHGLSETPFTREQAETLMRPLVPDEIEIKPDGLLYLPEILYRRILNHAFGPGGWGMVPRGELTVLKGLVTREWGLVAGGRLVSVARGEQTFFDANGMPTATEGCKSNALMRCCKDLGIASELWDPSFIRQFKAKHCTEAWTEHVSTKRKQKRWRKNGNKFEYPYTESKF